MLAFQKYNAYPEDLYGQSVSVLVVSRDSRRFPGKTKFLRLVHLFSEGVTFFTFSIPGEIIDEPTFEHLDLALYEFNSW